MTSTETLIEEAVQEFDEYNANSGGLLYPNRNSEWLRQKLNTIASKSAEAIKQERSRVVEIVRDFETNGQTRLLSETGFWTSHDLLDKQKLLKALENNES